MTSIATETLYTRLRSRIVEHLELIASANEQLACQQAVPIAHVSNELFNTWGDWVSSEAAIDELAAPIFSREEQQAVREFNAKLNAVAGQTVRDLPHITAFIGTPAWQELSSAASVALAVFMIRGVEPEDGGAI